MFSTFYSESVYIWDQDKEMKKEGKNSNLWFIEFDCAFIHFSLLGGKCHKQTNDKEKIQGGNCFFYYPDMID